MSNKICPNCDHANPPNSKFCSNCGRRLPPSTEIICPNCQTPNPHNLFYCDNCGARLVKETLPTEVDSDPGLEEPEQPSVHPADLFSLPTRKPGDTGKLDRNTLPDWLRTGGREEDEDEADDETIPEPPAEEAPARRRTTDDLPDWLVTDSSVDLYQPPNEITTEAFLQMSGDEPPELGERAGITDDLNLPDWLTDAVKDTDALREKKPTKPQPDEAPELPNPFETSTNIPEWLREVGGLTKDTEPTAEAEEDEGIPTVEEWGFSESADDDTLDWLMDSEAETAEPKVAPEEAINLSDLREWGTAVPSSANLPDWYDELARPNSEKLNNWLLELDDVEEPEFVIDEPEGSSVADRLAEWLSESDEPATPDTDNREVTGMLTGWLSELDQDSESDYQEDAEEAEDRIATGMLTGWLDELDDEAEADLPDEETKIGQLTGWLVDEAESDEPDFLDESDDDEDAEPEQFTSWLSDSSELDEADFPDEEAGTGQFTGWLTDDAELEEPDFLDEAVDDEEAAHDEFTSWLSDSDETDDSDLLTDAPEIDQFTDWLAGEDEVDDLDLMQDDEESEEKAVTGMLTGWLAELDEEDESDFLADEVEEEVPEPTIVTDWLADPDELEWANEEMEGEETADPITESLPDWLEDFEQTEPAADEFFVEEDIFAETADEPELVDDPFTQDYDWLAEQDSEGGEDFAGAAELPPLSEPAFEEEPPLSQEPSPPVTSEEPTTGPLTEEEASEAFPEWLQDLRQVESQDKESQTDLVQEDLPDWLSNMKPSADTQGSSMSGLGLDVDLSDDFAEIPHELSGADLPDWLQGISTSSRREGDLTSAEHGSDIPDWLRPGEGEQAQQQDASGQLRSILNELPPPRDPKEGLAKADIPEWVDALKPKELTGGKQQAASASPAPESGPLLGVQGVIEIAPVMAASHAAHKVPVNELTVTPEQQQQAELLQQLAQGELLLSETAVFPRRRLAWGRLLLALILLAVMSAAIMLDTPLSLVREDTVPAPAPIEMAQTAVTAAAGQTVLVAFDYTPALEGELAPEAAALMAQLAANGSPVIAVSQSAAGTAVAATYIDDSTLFIPGEAIGLRQMGSCLADECEFLFGRSLENDLSQVGLIILLTGERKSLVNWIEQVASQTNTPMLAATTQSLEPVAMSYVTSGQLAGIWSHLAALGRYEDTLPAATAATATQRVLNAQVLVQLLLVALLLPGLVRQLGQTATSRKK